MQRALTTIAARCAAEIGGGGLAPPGCSLAHASYADWYAGADQSGDAHRTRSEEVRCERLTRPLDQSAGSNTKTGISLSVLVWYSA